MSILFRDTMVGAPPMRSRLVPPAPLAHQYLWSYRPRRIPPERPPLSSRTSNEGAIGPLRDSRYEKEQINSLKGGVEVEGRYLVQLEHTLVCRLFGKFYDLDALRRSNFE